MNIDELTLGQLKTISSLNLSNDKSIEKNIVQKMIGKKVIIRTYSAGVWFGTLKEKSGNEVIIEDARRMWRWFSAESISLSAVSIHGIIREKSKICEAVNSVWLEAIEIIPCTEKSIESIGEAENVKAE